MLDLTTIPLPDLKVLIVVCDDLGKRGNRYFEDQFVILSRVALSHHELLEMSEYKTDDLVQAIDCLKTAIDGLENLPDDNPGKMFLKYSFTAAHGELEKRQRRSAIKGVTKV